MSKNKFDTLTAAIQEIAPITDKNITKKSNLFLDLGFDSILYVSLVVELENIFKISVLDLDIEWYNIVTVGDLLDLVDEHTKKSKTDEC